MGMEYINTRNTGIGGVIIFRTIKDQAAIKTSEKSNLDFNPLV